MEFPKLNGYGFKAGIQDRRRSRAADTSSVHPTSKSQSRSRLPESSERKKYDFYY